MRISAFHQFLLYNGRNPANKITGYNNHKNHFSCGRPNLWAAEFINDLIKKDALPFASESFIGSWAAIEGLNAGSYQRCDLNEYVWSSLKGSGRWHANDNGGHFRILKDKTIQWLLMTDEEKKFWRALALTHEIHSEDLNNYAIKERDYRDKMIQFERSDIVASAINWIVAIDRSHNEIFIHIYDTHDPSSNTTLKTSNMELFNIIDLISHGIEYSDLNAISDYLDDNSCELEIDCHKYEWESGPWYFKFRRKD